ncbi:acyl-CoA thioesterase [bacterium]|nr:acyl-CoA thioesterase [bacterium]
MDARPLCVTTDFLIKLYDVDGMGYVSNITYVRWLEDLRTLFLEKYAPLAGLLARDISPVMAQTHIDYLRPLTMQDSAHGEAWILEAGRTKWTMAFEITQGNIVHCRAQQKGYFINLKSGRPAPMPDEITTAYATEHLDDT